MFNVIARPEFTRLVEVRRPAGAGVTTEQFNATFRWVPSDELEAFDSGTNEGIKDLLRTVLVRADDLVGEDNEPLAWDGDVRETLLSWSNVRVALLLAYNKAWVEEKRGN